MISLPQINSLSTRILGLCFLFLPILITNAESETSPFSQQAAAPSSIHKNFELTNRTSFETQQSTGIRIQAAETSGLEWRILSAPSPIEFDRMLNRAEEGNPFDLIFPLASASIADAARQAPLYPGLFADHSHPLSLPGPGLEFQIGFDSIWSVAYRPVAPIGQMSGMLSSSAGSLLINSWNNLSTSTALDAAAAWTVDFASISPSATSDQTAIGSRWLAMQWVAKKPWLAEADGLLELPFVTWQNRQAIITQVSRNPFPIYNGVADFLLQVPDSAENFPHGIEAGKNLTIGFAETPEADRCPTILGGVLPLIWQGEKVAPIEQQTPRQVALPIRKDLKPCFEATASLYSWIGISHTTNEVWLGISGLGRARQSSMQPHILTEKLLENGLDHAGICSVSDGSVGMRWQGQWLGSSGNTSPGNITAALCLRLNPDKSKAGWANVLRDPQIRIKSVNTSSNSGSIDALHDARMHPGAALSSFWWASPAELQKPVILEFDLGRPISIFWAEMLHAGKAGFSTHFNLRNYTWQMRSSGSGAWTDAAQATDNTQSVTRHVLSQPIQARWWRLVIPPPDATQNDIIHRLVELELWTLAD